MWGGERLTAFGSVGSSYITINKTGRVHTMRSSYISWSWLVFDLSTSQQQQHAAVDGLVGAFVGFIIIIAMDYDR